MTNKFRNELKLGRIAELNEALIQINQPELKFKAICVEDLAKKASKF